MNGRASAADLRVDPRELRVNPPGLRELAISGRRAVAHLDDGRQVVWEPLRPPGRHLAVDAERADRPARASIAQRCGLPADPAGFALAWTALEVECKLVDVPILAWLRERGSAGAAPTVRTAASLVEGGRLAVCVGCRP